MSYAIISVGGKQYRVREGESLLVDRVALEDGATFSPRVLLVGGEGATSIAPADAVVTAKVVRAAKGPKIRIGKYKKRTGYKRHTGFRASLTEIEIESIGTGKAKPATKKSAAKEPAAEAAQPPVTDSPVEADAPVVGDAPIETAIVAEAAGAEGLPEGYAAMTVADVKGGVTAWDAGAVAAALAYEQEHGKRKGALAALEAALAEKEA